jgi:Retrotransposon gag protein
MAYSPSDFPHLSEDEWRTITRMVQALGPRAVEVVLTTLDEAEQHASVYTFAQRELQAAQAAAEESRRDAEAARQLAEEARQQVTDVIQQSAGLQQQLAQLLNRPPQPVVVEQRVAPPSPSHNRTLKLDVSKYSGSDKESLLRWLVELEAAIRARNITDPQMQVSFGMSCLSGRAKTWAFGRRLADSKCFATYNLFRSDLREAFEPPKSEFRARAEFLKIKQGKRDINAYVQHARYLVSCVVEEPIDEATKVVTYMTGLNDGPVKTYLFREYPETMEHAISLSVQEDFSLNQAYLHSTSYRPPRVNVGNDGPEPMDLSYAEASSRERYPRARQCHRCQKTGHFAHECMAPRPASRSNSSGTQRKFFPRRVNFSPRVSRPLASRSKNGKGQ